MTFSYDFNMACSACPAITPLTSTDYHQEVNEAHIACRGCGAVIHFGRAVMTLRNADDPVLDDGCLTAVAWYHTSTYSDWPVGSRTMPAATIEAYREHMPAGAAEGARARHENLALHVGTYEAAIESMLRRMGDQDDGGAQFFLYRVALRARDLTVERGWRDENTENAARLSQDDLGDADVVRYLNVFESPGSISLAIRPSAIAATQRIELPVETLCDGVERACSLRSARCGSSTNAAEPSVRGLGQARSICYAAKWRPPWCHSRTYATCAPEKPAAAATSVAYRQVPAGVYRSQFGNGSRAR
ncbi:hypothetical protein CFP75_05150 [Amycolatopsis alba DSM 44262]|uniref:Uncharacterized protein n=1 Tax=Amycolatopsis alba DSM 44262 TaxID=1125972 RepID=A0A229S6B5_AMYAL|nr:hypothetical protein CFP75_05150 [Amycolatopsis alba DSM 44262]